MITILKLNEKETLVTMRIFSLNTIEAVIIIFPNILHYSSSYIASVFCEIFYTNKQTNNNSFHWVASKLLTKYRNWFQNNQSVFYAKNKLNIVKEIKAGIYIYSHAKIKF